MTYGCILELSPPGSGLAFLQAVFMRITLSGTGVRNVEVFSANRDTGKDDQFGSSREDTFCWTILTHRLEGVLVGDLTKSLKGSTDCLCAI